MENVKLKRGQKRCCKCSFVNAARSRKCCNCRGLFKRKNRKIKNEIIDWKHLERGDLFRVVNGTGPYYILTRDCGEGEKGERLSLGLRGTYSVYEVRGNGIRVRGTTNKNAGFDYLYMGDDFFCEETLTHRKTHRIVKVRNRKRK